jgi:hypothetical protein
MADQQERERGQGTGPQSKDWDEQTRAAGNREGIPQEEAEDTPPGGDARTVYTDGREPGDVEPNRPER